MSDSVGRVIMSWNQKGGVGKTTNTINIAAGLGELGKRVLVVDTDAECGCTRGMGCPDNLAGTFEWIVEGGGYRELIHEDRMPPGVHLIPSRPDMAHIESHEHVKAHLREPTDIYTLMSNQIQSVVPDYDFVLIDTPPGPGAKIVHSVAAESDYVILAVKPDAFSFDALVNAITRTIVPMQEHVSLKLDILGVLISDNDGRSNNWTTDIVEPMARQGSEHLLFKHLIRHHRLVTECQRVGRSLFQAKDRNWKTNRTVLDDYRGVVREILYRIDHFDDYLDRKFVDLEQGYPVTETDEGSE